MRIEEIVLAVSNCDAAMEALPEELKAAILETKAEHGKRIEEEIKLRDEAKKRDEALAARRKKELEAKKRKLLCKGTWKERVPLDRRFVLCEREWENIKEHCVVDLLRGFKMPYFGYYGCDDKCNQDLVDSRTYTEMLKPVLEAEDDDKLAEFIEREADFFDIGGEEAKMPFCICKFESPKGGFIRITDRGPMKTLSEHLKDLEKEFGDKE